MSAPLQGLARVPSIRPARVAMYSSIHAGALRPCCAFQTVQTSCRTQVCRHRSSAVVASWQKDPWSSSSSSSRDPRRKSSSSSNREDKQFRFKYNNADVSLPENQLWRLGLPLAAFLGLAIFVGPLIVGVTVSAIAIGAALSAGALAFTTLLLPLILLSGIGGLLSFGLFATLGAAFALPSLAFLAGGLALGWGGVNWLISQTTAASNRGSTFTEPDIQIEIETETDEEKDFKRISSELRDFDELLARKDEQRRNKQWDSNSRY